MSRLRSVTREWLGRHPIAGRRFAAVAAVGLVTWVTGCEGVPPAARQMLLTANENYQRGQYLAAEQSSTTFLHHFESSPAAGEAYYIRGLSRAQQHQEAAARADFQAGAKRATRDDLRAYCHAMLGNYAYEDGDVAAAAGHYAAAEPNLPRESPTDLILYRYGVCLQRLGRWKDARQRFSRLLDQFASSPRADAARRLALWPNDAFSIQCGAFGRVDNANAVAGTLRKRGLSPETVYLDLGGTPMWRVIVGRYATYAEARADLARVRAIEPTALVVP